jgi:hypothetical protein
MMCVRARVGSENQRHARFSTVAEGNADIASIVRAVERVAFQKGVGP